MYSGSEVEKSDTIVHNIHPCPFDPYDIFYWNKSNKKKLYILWFCWIYIQLNGQKLPTSQRTCATHDARLLVCLVKPSNFFLILSKTPSLYKCNVISWPLFSLIFDYFMPNNTPPSSTYNSVKMCKPFQNPNVASQIFPEWLCQN